MGAGIVSVRGNPCFQPFGLPPQKTDYVVLYDSRPAGFSTPAMDDLEPPVAAVESGLNPRGDFSRRNHSVLAAVRHINNEKRLAEAPLQLCAALEAVFPDHAGHAAIMTFYFVHHKVQWFN
jgi:hypothetical protein